MRRGASATGRGAPAGPGWMVRSSRVAGRQPMNCSASRGAATGRNHSLWHGLRFALAGASEFGEHTSIHSAPLTALELAFRPRCYAAADDDKHWNTQWRELPLAALLSSRTAAEQVAAVRAAGCCPLSELPSGTALELAFRPRRYAAADDDKHWITQRSALALAALRSVALCCRASSCGPRGGLPSYLRESRS